MIGKPYEAIPSWKGYVYQGHIAIYYSLKKINKLYSQKTSDEELKKYRLEIEWMEDFAIRYGDDLESVHQVKCYNESHKNKYEDAIFDLLLKVIEYEDIIAYLHVKTNINWWNEKNIYDIFCTGIKSINDKLKKFLNLDKNKQDEKLKGNTSKKSIENMIYDMVKKYTHEGLDKDNAIDKSLEYLQNYLDNKVYVYEDEKNFKNIFNRVKLYKYNEECFINESDIKNKIKNELEIYYRNDEEKLNEKNFENVFLSLCGKIEEHVYSRNNSNIFKYITFKDIIEILNSDLQRPDDSYYIYRARKTIQEIFQEYCNDEDCKREDGSCKNCNLLHLMNDLTFLKLKDFDIFLSNVRANKKILDDKAIMTLFGGIEDSLFDVVREIDKFKLRNLKVLSNKNKETYLALICNDENKNSNKYKLVRNIIENDILFESLYMVNKIVTNRIHIDSIKDSNPDINVVPNVDERLNSEEIGRRITEIKDVSIISKEEAKGELSDD